MQEIDSGGDRDRFGIQKDADTLLPSRAMKGPLFGPWAQGTLLALKWPEGGRMRGSLRPQRFGLLLFVWQEETEKPFSWNENRRNTRIGRPKSFFSLFFLSFFSLQMGGMGAKSRPVPECFTHSVGQREREGKRKSHISYLSTYICVFLLNKLKHTSAAIETTINSELL